MVNPSLFDNLLYDIGSYPCILQIYWFKMKVIILFIRLVVGEKICAGNCSGYTTVESSCNDDTCTAKGDDILYFNSGFDQTYVKCANDTHRWGPKSWPSFLSIMQESNIVYNSGKRDDWDFYFPCQLGRGRDTELGRVKPTLPHQKIYGHYKCNDIANKGELWANMLQCYGREVASAHLPATFLLNNKTEISALRQHFERTKDVDDQVYVLKKIQHNKKGIKLTRDLEEMVRGPKDSYAVAQVLFHKFIHV